MMLNLVLFIVVLCLSSIYCLYVFVRVIIACVCVLCVALCLRIFFFCKFFLKSSVVP